jgi:hypothetical protein
MLTARNKMILPRAASGLTDKKRESAKAIAIAVSPTVIKECVRFSLSNAGMGGSRYSSDDLVPARRFTS